MTTREEQPRYKRSHRDQALDFMTTHAFLLLVDVYTLLVGCATHKAKEQFQHFKMFALRPAVSGEALGASLGKARSMTLGDSLGPSLGDTLGTVLGDALGPTSGAALGSTRGGALGPLIGDELGTMLGLLFGEALGIALGDTLGGALGEERGTRNSTRGCTCTGW